MHIQIPIILNLFSKQKIMTYDAPLLIKAFWTHPTDRSTTKWALIYSEAVVYIYVTNVTWATYLPSLYQTPHHRHCRVSSSCLLCDHALTLCPYDSVHQTNLSLEFCKKTENNTTACVTNKGSGGRQWI
jgi:hypothetical protein